MSRNNLLSMFHLTTFVILLTSILYVQTQDATGRGNPVSAPGITRNTDAASELPVLRGGIGMGTWDTKAEFRDIIVQNSDKILLQPYFNTGLEGWQKGGGEWSGVSGVLSQKSRAINCLIICGENTWTNYTYSLRACRTEGTEGFLIVFAAQDSKNLYWWNIGGWGNTRTAIEKMTRGGKREIPGTAVNLRIETGMWYDIKIVVYSDTADCYFNGQLITRITRDKGSSSMPDAGPPTVVNNGNGPEPVRPSGTVSSGRAAGPRSSPSRSGSPATALDDVIKQALIPVPSGQTPSVVDNNLSILRGGIGLGTWDTKAEFRDILVQSSDKVLLRPYFTNDLNGWQQSGGEWSGVSSVLSQNSRATNCQIICGDNTWTNYTYSLKVRRTEGTEGFLIIFAAHDSKNLYWWNIGGWGNTRTAIEKITQGGKREIPGTAADLRIETGIWYDIKIALKGNIAECYFNNKLITTIRENAGNSTMPDIGSPGAVRGALSNVNPIESKTTRIWKSPNGLHAIKVVESITIIGRGDGPQGPIVLRRTTTNVTGLAIAADGTTSEQWQWSENPPVGSSYTLYIPLQVADVLVADSGNHFVLLGNCNSIPSGAFQRVIVILDDKGKTCAEVTAEDWWNAFGADGKIADNPLKLSFLDDEKVLELKLESGKTLRVNTDSGVMSIERN